MLEATGGGIGTLFGLVGLLFAAGGVAMIVGGIRTAATRKRLLATGLAAEARCLDTYTRQGSEGPGSRHAVLSFSAADGREIRIQPVVTGPVVQGDYLTVRYDPARPQRAVIVAEAANSVGNGCAMAIGLVVAVMFIVVGLGFAVAGFGVGLAL